MCALTAPENRPQSLRQKRVIDRKALVRDQTKDELIGYNNPGDVEGRRVGRQGGGGGRERAGNGIRKGETEGGGDILVYSLIKTLIRLMMQSNRM